MPLLQYPTATGSNLLTVATLTSGHHRPSDCSVLTPGNALVRPVPLFPVILGAAVAQGNHLTMALQFMLE